MKYYMIKTNYNNPFPSVINWYNTINPKMINEKDCHKIKPWTLLEMNADKDTVFPDILTDPYILLSTGATEVVKKYEPGIKMIGIQLYNRKNFMNKEYYLPILPVVDCLSEKSEFLHRDMDIKKGMILPEKTGDRALFQLGGIENIRVVIRMDLLESLLRRGAFSFILEELSIEGAYK